jgi:hypothetical protein
MSCQTQPFHLETEIRERLGVLPNFFLLAPEVPQGSVSLWRFAQVAYLENPLPALFKERLFVYLSRFCEVRYCITRHVGFLLGLGHAAGNAQAEIQTVEQILRLLRRPFLRGDRLTAFLSFAADQAPLAELPNPESDLEEAIFAITSHIFLQTPEAPLCLASLTALLDGTRLQYLNLFLLFVRSAHYWTEIHPELMLEEDIEQFLANHENLAECIRHDPEGRSAKLSSDGAAVLRELEEKVRLAAREIGLRDTALAAVDSLLDVLERQAAELNNPPKNSIH